MRRAVKLAAFAATLLAIAMTPALARDVGVSMDEVTLVTFDKPIAVVYMGNTVIADVTMVDSHHAFVLGKTYGATNLIALGTDGALVSNQRVTVYGKRTGLVTLNRGSVQFNYSCTSNHCEAQPVPGDLSDYFKNTHDSQTQHEQMANSAAAGSPASTGPGQ